jgi:hypothetical protein
VHRQRTRHAALGQVLHETEEERQVVAVHPLLIKRQDELAAGRVDEEIGVLHPLGDAAIGLQRADVVVGEEGAEFGLVDVGVDGHSVSCSFR